MEKRPPMLREILALVFIGLLLQPWNVARAAPPTTIPSAALRADVAVLRHAYESMHPGLYRYNTKAEMDRHFAELDAAFARDRTLQDAYLAFSTFTAKLKCGHSYPNFFNQPKPVAAELFTSATRVPFYFRWFDGRMIVTRSFAGDPRVRPGTEIVAIDGIPASRILQRLLSIARADGSNAAKRVSSLELSGDSRYEAFDIYFPMFFPQTGDGRAYSVRAPASRRVETVRLASLTYDERVASLEPEGDDAGNDSAAWQLTFPDEATAILRMKSWALFNSTWDWKAFLGASFDELSRRGTPNLVIDLRGNEGGLDCGDPIVARLIDTALPIGQYQRRVHYRTAPADLAPYLDTWDDSFRDWGAAAVGPVDGFYTLNRYDDDDRGSVIAPLGPRYRGRVYVLVNAANSSATFQFANVVKRNGLATLVGQPTGGNQRGINGGAFFFLRLPNSQIEVDLPLIGTFPATPMPDAGITPDVIVVPSRRDVAEGIDTELAVVRRLIDARSRKPSSKSARRR